jgi:hypothetical protein
MVHCRRPRRDQGVDDNWRVLSRRPDAQSFLISAVREFHALQDGLSLCIGTLFAR